MTIPFILAIFFIFYFLGTATQPSHHNPHAPTVVVETTQSLECRARCVATWPRLPVILRWWGLLGKY